jgi:CheY-like chemotaxis protein
MSHADDGSPPETENRSANRVLLVDDNRNERLPLSRLFELRGFVVTPVADGRTAIATIESGLPFDILLTDLRLPDMDGREVALRASQCPHKPLVALMTGWDADSEDRARWGIDLIFIKPIDSAAVVSQIRAAQDARAGVTGGGCCEG